MGKSEIRYAAKVDLKKDAASQPQLHIECVDWTGGQIKNTDDADDIKNVDLTKIHYLSGPFEIENAEPGDVLVVEIQDVQPLQEQPWGFTGIFAKENGAIWDFEGIFCSSRHIPHVRFPGLIHPGILGCAPSTEILTEWNRRENQLISECAHMNRDLKKKVGEEGARTIPGRPEHGGNCDIKNLSRGSKVYLPVHVPGAKFSVGDLHFSQGDGEISFCGAIEMAGVITIKFKVMKNGVEQLAMKSPIYIPGPIPNACTTLGLPIDIFDFDIRPEAPVQKLDMGTCAFVTKK
ncbi:unnamed protein product [Aureobasidium pullulans]|nr:unnamed protein product [Aureobasidium pullulans]